MVRVDPSSKCQHKLLSITSLHYWSLNREGRGGRGLGLMSTQIECSQLKEETFRSCYQVSKSLIRYWGGVGASLSTGDSSPASLHSPPQRLPPEKKGEPRHVENVCLLQPKVRPAFGRMPERDLTHYNALLYIAPDRPLCYDLSHYQEVTVENIQMYRTSPEQQQQLLKGKEVSCL